MTHPHLHPAHPLPLPGRPRPLAPIHALPTNPAGDPARISGRSGTALQMRLIASADKRLLDSVTRASANNPDATHLVQHFLPAIHQFEADFPGHPLTIRKMAHVPNHHLNFLDNLCRYQPVTVQSQARMDVEAMRQLDQELAGFHLQIGLQLLTTTETIPGR